MREGTWGSILFLVENQDLAAYGRPTRFGPAGDSPPFAQFAGWPAVYQVAIRSNLHEPGQPITVTVRAITRRLMAEFSSDELRRLPLSSVAAWLQQRRNPGSSADVPDAPASPQRCPTEGGGADVSGGAPDGPGCEPGGTAEESVRSYLAAHPTSSLDEAKRQTGLTEQRIRRTKAWKEHEDADLSAYLQNHPDATTVDVGTALGYSRTKVVGMGAWKKVQARRKADGPVRPVRERPLTRAILESRPDAAATDPSTPVETRDLLFHRLLEAAEAATRLRLNELKNAEREALLDHLLEQMDPGSAETPLPTDPLEVLLLMAENWLDDHGQQRRRAHRDGDE